MEGEELKGLALWIDENNNARCESEELKSLEDYGVAKISTEHENYVSRYVTTDGSEHTMWDWWPCMVEVRMHSGTYEASKILLWISLWMQILWAAAQSFELPAVRDRLTITPNEDILTLVKKYLPPMQPRHFLRRLKERRHEIVEIWQNHPNLRPWVRFSENWEK